MNFLSMKQVLFGTKSPSLNQFKYLLGKVLQHKDYEEEDIKVYYLLDENEMVLLDENNVALIV